ncbi:MAG TPA: acylneuraminate cytidylyltransferase family protein [Puia sp.]|nr:acylneuraminate cytidylyltransferase family protein [Puia sp.]
MDFLFVIPARGGSKGIPGKNIKLLNNKPLIYYSIELARLMTDDEHICVSTDSSEIKACVEKTGLKVPFLRPPYLATDTSGSYEVLEHAVEYYISKGKHYDAIVLLQPTSPLRKKQHVEGCIEKFTEDLDMVASVKESKANPYYNLFEENEKELLTISKGKGQFTRRQDVPKVYEYNGSIYIINIKSLRSKKSFQEFASVKKYVMEEKYSIDLDTPEDWDYAEYKMQNENF